MKRISLREWVKINRSALDSVIARLLGLEPPLMLNDSERRDWVMNDEALYRWAKFDGVSL